MERYYKVWFANESQRTTQLILSTEDFPFEDTPMRHYRAMFSWFPESLLVRFCRTGLYDNYEEATLERRIVPTWRKI